MGHDPYPINFKKRSRRKDGKEEEFKIDRNEIYKFLAMFMLSVKDFDLFYHEDSKPFRDKVDEFLNDY